MISSIWKPNSVDTEPDSYMLRWVIFRVVKSELREKQSDHVVGYCGEGRVSSTIQVYDPVNHIAVTRSGRKYHIPPENVGMNNDALYVWDQWCVINKVEDYKDVSDQYINYENSSIDSNVE